ncbi:MAG: glycoside hydrolase family 99-like domain-containing protein [Fibromonadales bacterium]|nr:glycoside hydrolase family 99-like domain-containing protein [Fibromonadales bacterium]
MNKKLRALGVVLPQFHPIPENDEWWGKGFTEWTNVAKAIPRFKGHYQPHIPADLGFYDLRLEESRIAQAELAKKYGIYGFCYYHYWFNGKQLLEKPVNEIVASGKPDFPFCLCWANHHWGRNWDGSSEKIMQAQEYSNNDHLNHFNYLVKIFKDERYIKVNGRPLFIITNIEHIPNVGEAVGIWNAEAKNNGFEKGLYLLGTNYKFKGNPIDFGFEGTWDFMKNISLTKGNLLYRIRNRLKRIAGLENRLEDKIIYYSTCVENAFARIIEKKLWKVYPEIVPGWDNSARRKKEATIIKDSTPELYEKWLANTCEKFEPYSEEENFILLNAMNEWAEGNHLEPDLKWGLKYLEATKRILEMYK